MRAKSLWIDEYGDNAEKEGWCLCVNYDGDYYIASEFNGILQDDFAADGFVSKADTPLKRLARFLVGRRPDDQIGIIELLEALNVKT